MKIISLVVLQILAVIGANISFVWVIIEFILYLVKDKSFNWWSVWIFIISVVMAIGLTLIVSIIKIKSTNSLSKKMTSNLNTHKRSKFQERLEQLEKKKIYK